MSKSVGGPLLAIANRYGPIGPRPPFTMRLRKDCTDVYVTKTGSSPNSQDALAREKQGDGRALRTRIFWIVRALTSAYHHRRGAMDQYLLGPRVCVSLHPP